jgi:hypothetical protein
MSTVPNAEWLEANQRWLTQALDALGETLERRRAASDTGSPSEPSPSDSEVALDALAASMPAPPALEVLCGTLRLTRFERNILLLCAGVELDGRFARRCADAAGAKQSGAPTYGLLLAVLPEAHWSAVAPTSPLRRWRLVEIQPGDSLVTAPLRIDERILHYLAGVSYLDPRLDSVLEPLVIQRDLVPSHRAVADRIVEIWSEASSDATLPVVQLHGQDAEAKYLIAPDACRTLGLGAYRLDSALLPTVPAELDALSRLWTREAALMPSALVVDVHDIDPGDGVRRGAVRRFVESTSGALIVAMRTRELDLRRACLALDVPALTRGEQHDVWRSALGSASRTVNGECLSLVSQFNLGVTAIHAAAREARDRHSSRGDRANGDELAAALWAACRTQARPALANLARHIDPRATWEDLVLPASKIETLRHIAVQVRQRYRVYDEWGFAARSARGLGISALFWGPSGAGKTMAAEVLANELCLDLYQIDLSSVVSKYIGETEKNLRRVFDAAEAGGAILLFDEADALFGKRSEVKDSHDRYANVEISYLLQRMEEYRGLAILTTNMKTALDAAFQRRIRFIIQFPFPDAAQRAEIWRKSFPSSTPSEGLDAAKLARLNVAGGHIRNIALNAAFRAADERSPVQMRHLLEAARSEYAKMERPLTDAETREWTP